MATSAEGGPGPRGRLRLRWPRRRTWLFAGLVAVTLAGVLVVRSVRLALVVPRASHLLLDRRGQYLGELAGDGESLGYWPLPNPLPSRLVVATLETEDRHFFRHRGVHLPSVLRALGQNLRHREIISGASTLAMQVARMQRPSRRDLLSKAREAIEALGMVHRHGHDALLRQYLTLAPYGNRAHGATRAARLYFDKPVEDLSWKQAAFLAALPQLPGRMNPYQPTGLRRALRRTGRILSILHVRGYLSADELAQANASELGLVPLPHRRPEALHAVLMLSSELASRPGHISTATLDLSIQTEAARILAENLRGLRFMDASATAGLVVDVQTGEVLASVGSHDFFSDAGHGSIDYTRVKRSPGSALKPFIYGLGFETGRLTAATELPDTPLDLAVEGGRSFVPENSGHGFLGPVLARDALANSRNIPALRALAEVGVEPTLRLLERGGVRGVSFQPGAYGLTLATGSLPVTLEELVGLYTALAHDGERLPLRHFVEDAPVAGTRLFTRETTQLLANILSDPMARRPSFPAGSALDYPYAVAVKTGTSTGFRDAWAVAFSDRLLVGVWVGNHDLRRMNDIGGLAGAAGAVRRIFDGLTPIYQPHRSVAVAFASPERYAPAHVCSLSGRRAGPRCPHARVESFRPGTEPTELCPYHVTRRIDLRNGLLATDRCPARYVRTRVVLDLPEHYTAWAERQHLELAPRRESPFCGPETSGPPRLAIREPRDNLRLLYDPELGDRAGSVRLAARVAPSTEQVVWLVDGVPVGTVGYPHVLRWRPTPGPHVIRAALARTATQSAPVRVFVGD